MSGPDLTREFDWIARLRPLTRGDPGAAELLDDAAVLASRPGFELVITQDAMVEGVHVLPGEAPGIVARRLLRTNLSDLAAKAAEPFGYFLTCAFPPSYGAVEREAFARGLAQDGETFGLSLLGGDTVSTPGPLTVSATLLGWAPAGRAVRRGGAKAGDLMFVTGTIGDGRLGLAAARERGDEGLAARYHLPEPRLGLRDALLTYATAAADVSDGLLADARNIAIASGCGVSIELNRLPLSPPAAAWLSAQADPTAARVALATGGDDYEIVCTAPPSRALDFRQAAARAGLALTIIGAVVAGEGLDATCAGTPVEVTRFGWSH